MKRSERRAIEREGQRKSVRRAWIAHFSLHGWRPVQVHGWYGVTDGHTMYHRTKDYVSKFSMVMANHTPIEIEWDQIARADLAYIIDHMRDGPIPDLPRNSSGDPYVNN